MRYRITKGLEKNPLAAEIRKRVFIEEQGFRNEFDEIDKNAWHIVMYVKDKPAATGRMFYDENGSVHIGRIAVLKDYRGKSAGTCVMSVLEKKAADMGSKTVELSAQVRIADFYTSMGYKPVGDIYSDEGCPHIKMIKKLAG